MTLCLQTSFLRMFFTECCATQIFSSVPFPPFSIQLPKSFNSLMLQYAYIDFLFALRSNMNSQFLPSDLIPFPWPSLSLHFHIPSHFHFTPTALSPLKVCALTHNSILQCPSGLELSPTPCAFYVKLHNTGLTLLQWSSKWGVGIPLGGFIFISQGL